MRIECDVIQDILPLYMEKISSEASNKLVEEHLKECEKCRVFLNHAETEIETTEVQAGEETEQAMVKKSFQKLRLRWAASVLIAVVLVSLVGKTVYNETTKTGICFSNLDELAAVYNFMDCIESMDYEKAMDYLENAYKADYALVRDCEYGQVELHDMIHGDAANMSEEEYVQFRKSTIIERLDRWDDNTRISDCRITNIYYNGNEWCFEVNAEQQSLADDATWNGRIRIMAQGDELTSVSDADMTADEIWWDIGHWICISDIYHK